MPVGSRLSRTVLIPSLFFVFLSLAACSASEPTGERTAVPGAFEPAQVVIESIEVQQLADSAGSHQAVVRGYLTNNCSRIADAKVSQSGDNFHISFETEPLEEGPCRLVEVPFERVVTLDTSSIAPGTYIVTGPAFASFSIGEGDETSAAAVADPPAESEAAASGQESGAAAGSESDTAAPGSETGPAAGSPGTEADPVAGDPDAPALSQEGEPAPACEDVAAFVEDITYPDQTSVEPGEVFTKTWRVLNVGTCPWGAGYDVVFLVGDEMAGVSAMDQFPDTPPGDTADLSVLLTAPDDDGVQAGTWQIEDPDGVLVSLETGEPFDMWVQVVVGSSTAAGQTGPVSSGDAKTATGINGTMCAQGNPGYDDQLLGLINTARSQNGLPPLALHPSLVEAAWVHSADMACNDFISHIGTNGSDWFSRILAQGYEYDDALENIFFGFGALPSIAMNWWMNSDIHRGNILNSDVTEIGISYVLNPQTGASYYTLVFAKP